MIDEDEYLERVVRGINALSNPDAEVKWNEKIGGRQFDVVMRFSAGPYRFVALIEVKDTRRRTSAEEIEAFITKARDQLADKVIFVTKSGYQSGAVEIAKRHGVELFQVEFLPGNPNATAHAASVLLRKAPDGSFHIADKRGVPPENSKIILGAPDAVNVIDNCHIIYADGSIGDIPDEPTQMQYYAQKSKFLDGRTIADILATASTIAVPIKIRTKRTIPIEPPAMLLPPDEYFFKTGTVRALAVELYGAESTPQIGPIRIDPTAVAPIVEYLNVVTGESRRMNATELPVGESELHAGRYYFGYHPLRYFYCREIRGNSVTMLLIESFQNGELMQVTFTHDRKYSWHYIPVIDKEILWRLEKRRIRYEKNLH